MKISFVEVGRDKSRGGNYWLACEEATLRRHVARKKMVSLGRARRDFFGRAFLEIGRSVSGLGQRHVKLRESSHSVRDQLAIPFIPLFHLAVIAATDRACNKFRSILRDRLLARLASLVAQSWRILLSSFLSEFISFLLSSAFLFRRLCVSCRLLFVFSVGKLG